MPQAATPAETATRPNSLHDILTNLIVAFLAPMFLAVSGGDLNYARKAALETVSGYRVRNHMDLIAIAQIIAFGLAALGSLSQSMADDISLSMSLRLRTNANALNRSAERTRRTLTPTQAPEPTHHHSQVTPEPDPVPADEALSDVEILASMAFAQELAIDAQASLDAERQARTQAPALTPAATAKRTAEKRHQAQWAIAMVKEAQEISASIPGLPHVERRAALIRAGALSSAANELLTGVAPAAHGPNTREHP